MMKLHDTTTTVRMNTEEDFIDVDYDFYDDCVEMDVENDCIFEFD